MKGSRGKRFSLLNEALEILETLRRNGFVGYVVGGAVRDLLQGLPVSDWDLATDATPDRLVKIFPKVIPTGIRHGTVTVHCKTSQYELTTFRTDGDYASQHHLSRSCITRDIEADLRHRDFTINAMAYDPLRDKLIDPFGGQKDIKKRIIRGVQDPLSRFMEDGLRTYRAIRFSVTLDYRIEEKTLRAIPLCLEKARATSWERVREEIFKILQAKNPSKALRMMRKTGLLSVCLPELLEGYQTKRSQSDDVYHHILATIDAVPRRPILRLACLLHEIGKPRVRKRLRAGYSFDGYQKVSAQMADVVTNRLRLSNNQKEYIHQLIENHVPSIERMPDGPAIRRFLSGLDVRFLDDIFRLAIADQRASKAPPSNIRRLYYLRRRCHEILRAGTPLNVSQLAIGGDKVKKILGITESVGVGRILSQLLDIVLEDPEKNNPEDLTTLVKKIGKN